MLCALTGNIFAGGFQINEHSARAMAMGGAFTAVANDPSAIYFNAAGLTQLKGTHFLFGTTLIAPVSTFRGVAPAITEYDMNKQVFFPSHFWASHSVNDNLALGIGFTSPFGLGTQWDQNWVGRYLAIETSLKVFTISPVVAYKINDNISISAGLVYSWATVKITQKNAQTPFPGDAFITLDGSDNSAWGYNLGLLLKPTPQLSIGVSYHSQIKYNFSGTAVSTGAQQLIDADQLPNTNVTAKLTSPVNLAVGIAYQVMPDLKLSFDYQYVGWSSYDTLAVDFSDPKITDIASPRLYDNSYILRFGAEYNVNKEFSLGGGIYFDKNPVKNEYLNPSLPEGDRLGFSFGFNYKLSNNLVLSASYLFIRAKEVTVTNSKEIYTNGNSPFNGTYNSYANLASISFSYSL